MLLGHRWEQSERNFVPRLLVNTAVSEDQTICSELKCATHEAIGKFARLDRKWTDIASQLLRVVVKAIFENYFKDSGPWLIGLAVDQCHEVWFDGHRNWVWCCKGKEHAHHVDVGGWTRRWLHLKCVDKQRRDYVHAMSLVVVAVAEKSATHGLKHRQVM